MEAEQNCCRHEPHKKRKWYFDPLLLVSAATIILLALSFVLPILFKFRETFLEYLRIIFLPVLAGLIIGGIVDHYIPSEYISKLLTKTKKRTVLYATCLGFLASACSHGVLALSMELHKKGAPGSAVVSFLLASPWANLPITLLLVGFFGPKGLLIIMAALTVSITTGLVFQILDQKGLIEHNRHTVETDPNFSIKEDLMKRFRLIPESFSRGSGFPIKAFGNDIKSIGKGTLDLAKMVLWWIILGMLLASLISSLVPEHIFHRFMGPSFAGLLITLLIAAILEICSEGTSPLAFEIYKQTGAFGNAFAFLMGGVVTDYTEIGLIWMNLGKKTALWMIAITIPQVLLFGLLFNYFF